MAKKESAQTPQRKPTKVRRYDVATQAVRELAAPTTLTELAATAYKRFVEVGGKCDQRAMLWDCKQAIRSAEMFGLVAIQRNEVTITPIALSSIHVTP
jgi:hypothetical protein